MSHANLFFAYLYPAIIPAAMSTRFRQVIENKETVALLMVGYLSLVWGTTYLAVKIAIRTVPIFMMTGVRELLAGGLLLLLALILEKPRRFPISTIVRQGVYGLGFFTGTRGLMALALDYVQSGLVALIFSLIPVYVLFLNVFAGQFYFNRQIGLGLALGALGMFFTFRDSLEAVGAKGDFFFGIVVALFAALSWAGTSVLVAGKREVLPPFFRAAVQLLFGAAGLGLISLLRGERVDLSTVSAEAMLAIGYLALFGSVLAFLAFIYAIRYLPVARATLYAYLNPFVALFLGWLVLGEPLTLGLLGAFTLTLAGVFLVNRGYRQKPA